MSSTDKYNFAKTNPLKKIPAKLIGFTDDELNTNIEDTSIASKGTAINDFYNKDNKLNWYDGTLENRTGLPLYNQALSLFKVYTATSVVEVGYEIELKSGTISDMNDLLEFENTATITQWYINGYAESEANVRKCINAGGKHSFSFKLSSLYAGKITLIETNSFGINLFRDWYFKEPIQGYERVEIHNRNPDKAIQRKLESYCPFYKNCNKFINFYLVKNTIVSGGQTVRYQIPKDYSTNRAPSDNVLVSIDDSEITGGVTIKLFDTDGTTELASNFAAINTDLESNDRTGGFLEVSGLPTGDVAKVVVTISDFPTVEKVCGAASGAGFLIEPFFPILYVDRDKSTINTLNIGGIDRVTLWQRVGNSTLDATPRSTDSVSGKLVADGVEFNCTNDEMTFGGSILSGVVSGSNVNYSHVARVKVSTPTTGRMNIFDTYGNNPNIAGVWLAVVNGRIQVRVGSGITPSVVIFVVAQWSCPFPNTTEFVNIGYTANMSVINNLDKVKIWVNGVLQTITLDFYQANFNPNNIQLQTDLSSIGRPLFPSLSGSGILTLKTQAIMDTPVSDADMVFITENLF